MKIIAAFFCCIVLLSCSSSQLNNEEFTKPELIEQYPLPPIPFYIYEQKFVITLNLYLMEDGSIREVIIDDDRLDKQWAAQAKESILKWRYTPARLNKKPIKVWISQRTVIEIAEPIYFMLSEIQFDSLTAAQRTYTLLKEGAEFGKLANVYSVAASGKSNGFLGNVDVQRYPSELRKEILRLKKNEFTRPLKYGEKYVIFKRLNL